MNPEWIVTGVILLGAMAVGGVSLYLKRKKEIQTDSPEDGKSDLEGREKNGI